MPSPPRKRHASMAEPAIAARPQVAIITVTYNRARTLEMAIQSVISQSYPNLRLVVVDDGSTDETQSVLARHQDDHRVTLVQHDANRGVLAARNTGLDQLTTQDIFFGYLDSDDVLLPDAVETMVQAILERGDQHSMVWASSLDAANGRPDGWHIFEGEEITFDDQLAGRLGGDHMQLVRREAAAGLRYLPQAGGGEGNMWTKVLEQAPALLIPDVVQLTDRSGADRVSVVGFSRSDAEKHMWTNIYELRTSGRELRHRYPKRYARLLRQLALAAAMSEDPSRARPASRQALRMDSSWRNLLVACLALAPARAVRWVIHFRARLRSRYASAAPDTATSGDRSSERSSG